MNYKGGEKQIRSWSNYKENEKQARSSMIKIVQNMSGHHIKNWFKRKNIYWFSYITLVIAQVMQVQLIAIIQYLVGGERVRDAQVVRIIVLLTSHDHHTDGEHLLRLSVWRHVSKPHTGHTWERVVETAGVRLSRGRPAFPLRGTAYILQDKRFL